LRAIDAATRLSPGQGEASERETMTTSPQLRVTDSDLEFMVDVMRGHAEPSDCDHSRELAEALRAELLALREVADAARFFVSPCSTEDCPNDCMAGELNDALKRAGR